MARKIQNWFNSCKLLFKKNNFDIILFTVQEINPLSYKKDMQKGK